MSLVATPGGHPFYSSGGYGRMRPQAAMQNAPSWLNDVAGPTGRPSGGMGFGFSNMLTPTNNPGMRDIFNKAIPQFGQPAAGTPPPQPNPMPQFQALMQNFQPPTGGPTPMTPAPNPMPQFQALMQNFQPQTGGPTPQQPPPFVPPQPMPFIPPRPMQVQMPNFSYLGGQTAPPDPMMMMPPNMKGMFGVR